MKSIKSPMLAVTGALIRVTPEANRDGRNQGSTNLNTAPRISSVRSDRALRLLAGFGALRRDQLETLLLGRDAFTTGSRRVLCHRTAADLRERALIQDV